ncbi:MAG: hypothetical protein ABI882_22730, partial [Acidobacteriota bacterium]
KKQLLVGLLFSVLATVIYYQFFASDERPASARTPLQVGRPQTSQTAVAVKLAQNREPTIITEPLPLELLAGRGTHDGGTNRNIFVYPTPTPLPTPKPLPPAPTPLPPPIMITSVNPSGRIARTGDFEMTVMGAKIPADAKILINGQPYPTTILGEAQAKASIAALAISQSGNLRVEIKSAADTSLFSNALNLNVADPPIPPYLYVALVVNNAGVHMAVLKSQADSRLINVHKGDLLGKWRIVEITNQKIDVLDTEYNISHILGFTGEGG